MGYREWRERQLAKTEERAAKLEARYAELDAKSKALDAERVKRREDATAEAQREWAQRRAAVLREDHDDLVRRSEALGIPVPSPDRQMRGRGLAALGELVVRDGSGVEGGTVDAYEAWRDRIIVEESMVAKQARGESLSLMDRAALKAARFGSR